MKRIVSFILSAIMLFSMISVFAISTTAVDEIGIAGELIITEILANTPGTDYCEYMEIMNVSDHAIDLYDYRFWYLTGSRATVFPVEEHGIYTLNSGELALVAYVNKELKDCVDFSKDVNNDGSNRVYYPEKFRELAVEKYDWGNQIPTATKIFFFDSAINSEGAQATSPDLAVKWCRQPDGTVYGNGKGMAYGNSDNYLFSISKRDETVLGNAYLTLLNNGKSAGSCHFGAPATGASQMTLLADEGRDATPGYLSETQKASIEQIKVTTSLSTVPPLSTLPGASARISTMSGLRFETVISNEYLNKIKATGATVEIGTIIAPEAYRVRLANAGKTFTIENLETLTSEAKYLKVVANDYFTLDGDNYTFAGSIVGLGAIGDKPDNRAVEFAGRGYIKINNVYYYSPTTTTRSVAQVAQAAIQSGSYTPAEVAILQTLIP